MRNMTNEFGSSQCFNDYMDEVRFVAIYLQDVQKSDKEDG